MTPLGLFQIVLYFALILAAAKPMGAFMANVFEGKRTFLHPALRWLETLTYRVCGVREDAEQRWTEYTASLLSFSVFGFLLTYLLQRAQAMLPWNPQGLGCSGSRDSCRSIRRVWARCLPILASTPPSALSRTRTGRLTRANRP